MGLPCSVCAHPQRAEIDRRLAFQVVNVAQVARTFGLPRNSVIKHRSKHLPGFLPAFAARAAGLSVEALSAEAERLYLVTLDALAAAEQGVLIDVGKDGNETRSVSSSAVARMIREARAGLDLLAKLAAATDDAPRDVHAPRDDALEQRLMAALDRVQARADATRDVVDADVVDDTPRDLVRADGGGSSRGGEAPFSRTHQIQNPPELEAPPTDPEATHAASPSIEDAFNTSWKNPRWTGSPAASAEERAADGYSPIPLQPPNAGEPGSHRRSTR